MANHETRITSLEGRVLSLEKWQIKIIAYCTVAVFVISAVAVWLIKWSLDSFAAKILGS